MLFLSMLLNVQVDDPGVQDKEQGGPDLISTINRTFVLAEAEAVSG